MLATYHNLHYYLDLMHRIRNAILAGTLDDLEAELREKETDTEPSQT